MDLQLQQKTALVTGASTGIGRGIAIALAREGVHLAVAARRRNLLEELSDEIVAAGGTKPVARYGTSENDPTKNTAAASIVSTRCFRHQAAQRT